MLDLIDTSATELQSLYIFELVDLVLLEKRGNFEYLVLKCIEKQLIRFFFEGVLDIAFLIERPE